MPNVITEDQIERALVARLTAGFRYAHWNCYTSDPTELNDGSGRSDKREVILRGPLREAARRLNPDLPDAALDDALDRLCDRRAAMNPVLANREVHDLIRDGIPVEFDDAQGRRQQERVQVIDFRDAERNRFLAVTQLWVKGDRGWRRPDVLLYVNGLPLVFIELKNSNVTLRAAFDDNLTSYRSEIPQLFLCNAFCVLSNAIETRVGSMTAEWEHFFSWLRVDDEKERLDRDRIRADAVSLERVIDGLLSPVRLLDYVEHFILYYKQTQKIIAQNHQFIGVNSAVDRFNRRGELGGKLGVFWHTQGSGKSFSMIFYARKIMRSLTGNFTFVVVTDRDDLDGQIYRNFLHTSTVSEAEAAQPKNSEELRKFLGQNKRLVFTLIQKFRYAAGLRYPELSERDDIVVIVDEAHRTQYANLAENMRTGLPRANYLAFTGTPLLGRADKQGKTEAWFGGYVSEYTFQQSMEDGATVPLYYQKRVPEVLNQNENLSEEFAEILEDEQLDEAQQRKLEQRYASTMEVLKRDDRLDTIARDIVAHFPSRGYLGKGMVISVDKFTAVRMYDKVQTLWKEELKRLTGRISQTVDELEKARLKKRLDYMRRVQMAVIVSEEAEEEKKFAAQDLDIKPHRKRMNELDEHGHDVEYNFKDPTDPLQLVFVCAMWLTGFDAPTVSTLYLDKPMKDHTLMQTIARANRVTSFRINWGEKRNGEIVDYFNVFRSMKQALRAYGQGQGDEEAQPVEDKSALFALLDDAIAQGRAFCAERGVDLDAVLAQADVFDRIGQFNGFANTLLGVEDWRKSFNVYENSISALYEACKPEVVGRPVGRDVAVFQYLRGVIESIVGDADIDKVARRIGELLDQSIVVDGTRQAEANLPQYQIVQRGKTWDLSKIDFEKLREEFAEATYKNIEIADLRAFIEHKLDQMMRQNTTRTDFAQRLQKIIDNYNSGGSSNEQFYEDLIKYTRDLKAEDERHVREGLSEDELELYDLIRKDGLTHEEEKRVKLAARHLLTRLLESDPRVLVQDWFKDRRTQEVVRSAVVEVLDADLPDSYDRAVFKQKCDRVFEVVLDYASHGRKWAA
jgi:type I restriction enzyme R subunit